MCKFMMRSLITAECGHQMENPTGRWPGKTDIVGNSKTIRGALPGNLFIIIDEPKFEGNPSLAKLHKLRVS